MKTGIKEEIVKGYRLPCTSCIRRKYCKDIPMILDRLAAGEGANCDKYKTVYDRR